jgi:hypothetical protein
MHPHAQVIDHLYRSLATHNPAAMAECYHQDAIFEDIAFRLRGKEDILGMWKFVTNPKPQLNATFGIIRADEDSVHAWLIDDYIFIDTNRRVLNVIISFFRFRDRLIIEHRDRASPLKVTRHGLAALTAYHPDWLGSNNIRAKLKLSCVRPAFSLHLTRRPDC